MFKSNGLFKGITWFDGMHHAIRIVWMLHDEANSDVLLIGRVA
jgi:hypothetical protein|tara:strand:- start:481 stop:609 length:129 start_codon:yes stop_codon:yes gene_type:complete